MELKRKNKELQHEKRELVIKLDAAESKIAKLSNMTENEMVAQVREEVTNLKHTNEDLLKQVEGLQMNRFSEVEELVYLRWVNACLRFELWNYQTPQGKVSARDLSKSLSPRSQQKAKQLMLEYAGSERGQGDTDLESNFSQPSSPGSEDFDNASIDSSTSRFSSFSKKPNLIQKLKKWGSRGGKDDSSVMSSPARSLGGESPAITTFGTTEEYDSPETPKLPSIRMRESSAEALNSVASSFSLMSKSVEGVLDEKYSAFKDRHKLAVEREKQIKVKAEQARAARFERSLPPKLAQLKEKSVPLPGSVPVLPVVSASGDSAEQSGGGPTPANVTGGAPGGPPPPPPPPGAPPPPPPPGGGPPRPPPPPGSLMKGGAGGDKVHRAPELVEFYQTLMKRESKKDTLSALITANSNTSDARSNMIGEIENRSTFLLAVKADVESQGEFVESLATEVRAASFTNIEDLVAFVNWLDEELSFLVDERAVLKHFDWPEGKADALREAAFEYQDLMKLEKQVTTFVDDPNLQCDAALKKMYRLLEKEFGIPTDWLQDSGVVGKIKISSVQLARKYMKRVTSELDALDGPEKEPNREFLILQGVRFAFRVHQFAGGFDDL
ncbi:Protein CHUP1, chloroplastic [Capsicum baccatum]|uniref:Protein CHUP1, chloroplastic n=1 Tax=Capsicum baccatum TaxID=33114 RepID=A0A2G2V5F8_CAPBA|nr:Protein CHUP1, chloroplastic [Capsicum baccatum]